ncbi:MAG TPA: hypothetical protein VLA09_01085 [Longimicrobiales bacterium]|nr:hypothetical protein [Longimicrobiales bacterium]
MCPLPGLWADGRRGRERPEDLQAAGEVVDGSHEGAPVARATSGRSAQLAEAIGNGWHDVAPDAERLLMVPPLIRESEVGEPELVLVQNFLEELNARLPN